MPQRAENESLSDYRGGMSGIPRMIMASRFFAQRRGAFLGKFFRPALVGCGDCVKKDRGDDFPGDLRSQEIIHSTWTLDLVIGCLYLSVETICQFTSETQPGMSVGCDERNTFVVHSYQ